MRASRLPLFALVGLAVLGLATPAGAAGTVGGAAAPDGSSAGGAQFGAVLGRASAARPVAAVFRVAPHRLRADRAPRIAVRIKQRGVRTVTARIVFRPLRGTEGGPVTINLGRIRTGRLLHPAWPATMQLRVGRYVVALHARGPAGATLLRRAAASGRVPITVRPAPTPQPVPPSVVAPAVTPAAVLPDPAVSAAGVFPVQGPHTYGGDDARFGAGRTGHTHQGQDITAAEGVPVVAPLAGTIVARDYQAKGAGFYLTLDASDGRSFFFAHCQQDTFAVTLGQAVSAGQQLCRVGRTGASSGPHLHFEIWVGGWRRSPESRPVDPLAQLQAWDH